MPIWMISAVAAAAPGPAWTIEPLAPAVGVRLSASDQVQIDGLVRPIFRWRRSTSRYVDQEDPDYDSRLLSTGASLIATVRYGLQPTPSRLTVSAGGYAQWTHTEFRVVDQTDQQDPQDARAMAGWVGAGGEHRLTDRWSIGLDIQLASVTWGEPGIGGSGVFAGSTTARISTSTEVSLLSGLHVRITRYPAD